MQRGSAGGVAQCIMQIAPILVKGKRTSVRVRVISAVQQCDIRGDNRSGAAIAKDPEVLRARVFAHACVVICVSNRCVIRGRGRCSAAIANNFIALAARLSSCILRVSPHRLFAGTYRLRSIVLSQFV